jgi:hypothetical protein
MAIEQLDNGAPDGCTIGASASEKSGFHGTAAIQAAHIADATDATTALTRINAILVVLENKGLTATS